MHILENLLMPVVSEPENFPPEEPRPGSTWLSILFALVVTAIVSVLTFVLVSPLLVIVPLFGAIAWLQYLVWGRAMERYYAKYKAELEEEDRRQGR